MVNTTVAACQQVGNLETIYFCRQSQGRGVSEGLLAPLFVRDCLPVARSESNDDEGDARQRILTATRALIAEGGVDAATTRAIASEAAVQAPTIYRLFGDKQGLLDAAAHETLAAYVAEKSRRARHRDPLQDFRDGWDQHIAFGLAHPEVFRLLADSRSAATEAGHEVLRERIRNIARAGRLGVSEERALGLVIAMGTGTVLRLLAAGDPRDEDLATAARESVLAAITTAEAVAPTDSAVTAAAITLRASLDQVALSEGERALLGEWLERIASAPQERTSERRRRRPA